MAFTYGFYNSKGGDRKYNADQMGNLFDGILNDGVFDNVGNIFATVPGEGLQVLVKSGRAWFNKTWSYNDAAYPIYLERPDVAVPRIDAIVLEVDRRETHRRNRIGYIVGIPDSTPKKPTLTNSDLIHQHPLAYVTVRAGTESILHSDIEIRVGQSDCPFVTGILQTANIDDLFAAWNEQFTTWFEGVRSQLEGDVAANLLREIQLRLPIADKATSSEVSAGTVDNKYLTPKSLKGYLGKLIVSDGTVREPEMFPVYSYRKILMGAGNDPNADAWGAPNNSRTWVIRLSYNVIIYANTNLPNSYETQNSMFDYSNKNNARFGKFTFKKYGTASNPTYTSIEGHPYGISHMASNRSPDYSVIYSFYDRSNNIAAYFGNESDSIWFSSMFKYGVLIRESSRTRFKVRNDDGTSSITNSAFMTGIPMSNLECLGPSGEPNSCLYVYYTKQSSSMRFDEVEISSASTGYYRAGIANFNASFIIKQLRPILTSDNYIYFLVYKTVSDNDARIDNIFWYNKRTHANNWQTVASTSSYFKESKQNTGVIYIGSNRSLNVHYFYDNKKNKVGYVTEASNSVTISSWTNPSGSTQPGTSIFGDTNYSIWPAACHIPANQVNDEYLYIGKGCYFDTIRLTVINTIVPETVMNNDTYIDMHIAAKNAAFYDTVDHLDTEGAYVYDVLEVIKAKTP